MSEPALIIFAKQPWPGQVKTRLQPTYTAAQAADVAQTLIAETVRLVSSSWSGPIYLAGSPNAEHLLFLDLARRFSINLLAQAEGDLGARMQRALVDGIEKHGAAAVMGCDVPHCPPHVLHEVQMLLARDRQVLGPTDDGGYYLIGLTRSLPALFGDMPWGETSVLSTTLARGQTLGIQFALLKRLRDIDTPDDLAAAAAEYPPLRRLVKSP